MLRLRLVSLALALTLTYPLLSHQPEKTPQPFAVDLGISVLLGGDLIRYVDKVPSPVTLGFSRKPDANASFPWGHATRFSHFRSEEGDHIGEYYFLSYALIPSLDLDIGEFFVGYSVMFALYKERLQNREIAITYHDLFLTPLVGLQREIFHFGDQLALNLRASLHIPGHAIRETFLDLGLGVSFYF